MHRLREMFKCQFCGTQVPRGVPLHRIVTKTRPVSYPGHWAIARNTQEHRDFFEWRGIKGRKTRKSRKYGGKPKFIEIWIPFVPGWEIVEERKACPQCFLKNR